jgi:glucose-6-phosphate 1-dehydrogenase
MVQNHLLQLLCIVAMEPPSSADADAIRDEKLKVLRSLRIFKEGEVNQFVVRGQYKEGVVDGTRVPGYLDEEGVGAGSATETYVAIHAEIDNWRWAGVPFLLRTGKRLAKRSAEIVINFKSVPHSIYSDTANIPNNRLVISLQPSDSIELHLSAKSSSRNQVDSERLHPVNLDLNFKEAFGSQSAEAYERLLLMVMAGRLDLFVRFDEQQAAWRWVMPILESWKNDPMQPKPYAAGTWGPPAASALVANLDTAWPEEI